MLLAPFYVTNILLCNYHSLLTSFFMFLAAFLDYVSIIILSSLIINVTHFLIIGKRKIETDYNYVFINYHISVQIINMCTCTTNCGYVVINCTLLFENPNLEDKCLIVFKPEFIKKPKDCTIIEKTDCLFNQLPKLLNFYIISP